MRYIFLLTLFILPFTLYAYEAGSLPQRYSYVPKGAVTTRTGGSVVTRSYPMEDKGILSRPRAGAPAKKSASKPKTSEERGNIIFPKPGRKTTTQEKARKGKVANEMLAEQAKSYRQQGYELQSVGDWQGALTFYTKAMELDPYYVDVYNDLGVAYEALGDNQSALKMYEKALAIDPEYLPTYTNLAFLYEKRGDIANATAYWTKRYELGEEADYWRTIAKDHLMKLGTYPQVRKDIMQKQAAKFSTEVAQKQMERRLNTLDKATLHFELGYNLLMKKDYRSALREFETALFLNPHDEEFKERLRDIYKRTKKLYTKEEALTQTRSAIEHIRKDDFFSAEEALTNAQSTISRAAE